MEYQKQLLKRLLKMIEDNERQAKEYDKVQEKFDVSYWDNREEWQKRYNALTPRQKEIYHKGRIIYSNSAIKRVRIELNQAMIEWEKGE